MTDDTDERVTLRGTITLSPPGARPLTVELLEFRASGSFRAPTAFDVRMEGALRELAGLADRVPDLAPLFPREPAPDAYGVVELSAPPQLVAELARVPLPDAAPMDVNALLSCEPWSALAFDFGRYLARSVGVRTSHDVEDL